ncbi:MAG: LysR family transcriptional regulator [Alistipes finegoldii]
MLSHYLERYDDFRLKVFITRPGRSASPGRPNGLSPQPAVSKHIGELESQYKVQLFMRRGSRLELTGAGETLLACAERLPTTAACSTK